MPRSLQAVGYRRHHRQRARKPGTAQLPRRCPAPGMGGGSKGPAAQPAPGARPSGRSLLSASPVRAEGKCRRHNAPSPQFIALFYTAGLRCCATPPGAASEFGLAVPRRETPQKLAEFCKGNRLLHNQYQYRQQPERGVRFGLSRAKQEVKL